VKRVIILGSTGSIGRNTIEVIDNLKGFRVVGLAAYENLHRLIDQARRLKPEMVALVNDHACRRLVHTLNRIKVVCGEAGITELVDTVKADIIICALASSLGVNAILRAIEKKMRIGLATKEILVSFGDIIMSRIKKCKAQLIPIDSEHSAIYQCLEGRKKEEIDSLILTASGGPFLNRSIKNVTRSEVLNHPIWKMGKKITVDSATMMNKGLEVIEAHHLFGLPADRIKVVIHPEAICHSMVQFIDGTILAQLSTPDMRLPIQFALTAPQRLPSSTPFLMINKVGSLNFQNPDSRKFPCLNFAYEALKKGGSMPAVLNSANHETVKQFLDGKIKFHEISSIIKKVMTKHISISGNVQDYIQAEAWAREYVRGLV
jgi:1-deoxy-D-xylulose-5-phosphate reductoisomerase